MVLVPIPRSGQRTQAHELEEEQRTWKTMAVGRCGPMAMTIVTWSRGSAWQVFRSVWLMVHIHVNQERSQKETTGTETSLCEPPTLHLESNQIDTPQPPNKHHLIT